MGEKTNGEEQMGEGQEEYNEIMSELGGSLYLFYGKIQAVFQKRYKLKVDCVVEKTNGKEQMG